MSIPDELSLRVAAFGAEWRSVLVWIIYTAIISGVTSLSTYLDSVATREQAQTGGTGHCFCLSPSIRIALVYTSCDLLGAIFNYSVANLNVWTTLISLGVEFFTLHLLFRSENKNQPCPTPTSSVKARRRKQLKSLPELSREQWLDLAYLASEQAQLLEQQTRHQHANYMIRM